MGGIVPIVNLEGVEPGALVLDGQTLADIFQGAITKWDDAAIAKLNPGVKIPAGDIVVVHRSDGSGTSFNFTYYLTKVSVKWAEKVGTNAAPEWPVGVGAKGNEGVAGQVGQTKGSIGYVEYAYAKQNKLTWTKMINKDGKTVKPELASFQAAASNADWANAPAFYQILSNQPGAASWPMTAATFILMYKEPTDKEQAEAAVKFFTWAYQKGDKAAEALDYIPMPDAVVTLVKDRALSQVVVK
jgi:phosphate transport system substrate-binding protein